MSPLRWLSLLLLAVLSPWIPSTTYTNAQEKPSAAVTPIVAPDSCQVTKPGDRPFVPPPKYPNKLNKAYFWYGTDRLWIVLPVSGTWEGLPHYEPGDPTFRQKIQWWRQGFDAHAEPVTKLKITGRRLDSLAPPLLSDPTHGIGSNRSSIPSSIMSGVNFPTLGCWQVTGRYEQDELTFVIWIAP